MEIKNLMTSLIVMGVVLIACSGVAGAATGHDFVFDEDSSITFKVTNGILEYNPGSGGWTSLGTWGDDHYLNLSGSLSGSVTIRSNIAVHLNDVSITQTSDSLTGAFILGDGYSVTLKLVGTNTIQGKDGSNSVPDIEDKEKKFRSLAGKAGINVPSGSTLNITGDGTLNVFGGNGSDISGDDAHETGGGAAIGGIGGYFDKNKGTAEKFGTINIESGTINAIGGKGASNSGDARDIGGGGGAYYDGATGMGGYSASLSITGGTVYATMNGIGGGHGKTTGIGGYVQNFVISNANGETKVFVKDNEIPQIGAGESKPGNINTNITFEGQTPVVYVIGANPETTATDIVKGHTILPADGWTEYLDLNPVVTFYANGGTFADEIAEGILYKHPVDIDDTIEKINAFLFAEGGEKFNSPETAKFVGWFTFEQLIILDENLYVTNGNQDSVKGEVSLIPGDKYYAVWEYKIMLNPNGGYFGDSQDEHEVFIQHGTPVPDVSDILNLPENIPTYLENGENGEWEFSGWHVFENDVYFEWDQADFAVGTVYAVWVNLTNPVIKSEGGTPFGTARVVDAATSVGYEGTLDAEDGGSPPVNPVSGFENLVETPEKKDYTKHYILLALMVFAIIAAVYYFKVRNKNEQK
ncbi:hypothetical protein MmiAt1_08310 [Methanimicrococcus sp. At1]|uniref:Uncharacterized protein n=1 Tax=Methanimicrococcus hacksteinii TaxID=3028293 RepID=A0ABU3VPC1_9EURY|nr:hypothetical protein [Methanimicrococcus sp. At1]MDV0445263.1 hypothetical protein [Methanimicrococcus sp. At1]